MHGYKNDCCWVLDQLKKENRHQAPFSLHCNCDTTHCTLALNKHFERNVCFLLKKRQRP